MIEIKQINSYTKEIMGYKFEMTCGSCPEQYDVYKNDKQVAYVRFRYGSCTTYTEPLGQIICDYCNFDGWQGNFESERQRNYYLQLIAKQIEKFYQPKKPKRKYVRKRTKELFESIGTSKVFENIVKDIIEDKELDSGIKVQRYIPVRVMGACLNGKNKLNRFKDYRKYKKVKK